MIKQLKFKIYRHECKDCGWSIWRDYPIEKPICSQCGSETPPTITEEELVREMELYDTYTPEDYARAKKVATDIIAGVPLEEIEGLGLDSDLTLKHTNIPALFLDIRACVRRGSFSSDEKMWTESATLVLKDVNDKAIVSEKGRYY